MVASEIRVGSRDSQLAITQSKLIIAQLEKAFPGQVFSLVTMKTTGDIILDKSLDAIGGKGLFLRELDAALLDGRIDIAVHSLKDIPMELEPGTEIQAYSKREDPRDALILPCSTTLDSLSPDMSLPLGCSGLRRRLRVKDLYPKWNVAGIRGNVLTRLKKLDRGEYGGLVLAVAGLKRLGLDSRISRIFNPDEMLPSAGQGILAVVAREGDSSVDLSIIDDSASRYAAVAERAFVKTLDGGCSAPIAAYGKIEGAHIKLTGLYSLDENGYVLDSIEGAVDEGEALGVKLALMLREEYQAHDSASPADSTTNSDKSASDSKADNIMEE